MKRVTARTSELPPSASLRQTRSTPDLIRPDYCTCGAKLAENARFCHLCGRPVFEPEIPEPAVDAPLPNLTPSMGPPIPAARGPLPVGFRNPVALGVAFIMAVTIWLLMMIPFVQLLVPLWWLAAGSCAVILYRRLTGMSLSIGAGATLGSITGVLWWLSIAGITALAVTLVRDEQFRSIMKQNPELLRALNDPQTLALYVLGMLPIVVGVCAAGGAIGARFVNRDAKV